MVREYFQPGNPGGDEAAPPGGVAAGGASVGATARSARPASAGRTGLPPLPPLAPPAPPPAEPPLPPPAPPVAEGAPAPPRPAGASRSGRWAGRRGLGRRIARGAGRGQVEERQHGSPHEDATDRIQALGRHGRSRVRSDPARPGRLTLCGHAHQKERNSPSPPRHRCHRRRPLLAMPRNRYRFQGAGGNVRPFGRTIGRRAQSVAPFSLEVRSCDPGLSLS